MHKKRLRTIAKAYIYSKKYNPQSGLFYKAIDMTPYTTAPYGKDTVIRSTIVLHKKSVEIIKTLTLKSLWTDMIWKILMSK